MPGGGANERILVVEDDPDLRDAVARLLRSEGYQVSEARDGQEALDQMRASAPALVLLDLMMPVMDGFEFRVRQTMDPELAGIPVIVFSAGAELQRKVATLGAVACLVKPVDPVRLLEVIERLPDRAETGVGTARSLRAH